ncbi:MAG TPA: glycosyltransferase [Ruminiclostridium sp.]|nr:glycosyltransferase [Ruminiclostridium sp.]
MKYDYGKPEQGFSFEHCSFYHSLINMGYDVLYFDFLSLCQQYGKDAMNLALMDAARRFCPDLAFFILFQDEFYPEAIRSLPCPTFNWFCDDHWRYDNFSRHWAKNFTYISTTSKTALVKYKQDGFTNVIPTQWACNHYLYRPTINPNNYAVTFVGMPHGERPQIINFLHQCGIAVHCWGQGWPNGRISQEDMIQVFGSSKINLNLTNSSNCELQQIKGRNFEVPGCGGFLLTGKAENLAEYYLPDKEIACFETLEELTEKITYYVAHEDERRRIAKNGYERTRKEHTYEQRLRHIFQIIERGL